MRAAQANMRPAPVRRFYKAVEVGEADGRHALMLDGRRARTPGRNPWPRTAGRSCWQWRPNGSGRARSIDPTSTCRLTRLLNSAIDGVAHTMAETRADILGYAGSDLLCYRAEEPETLAARQAQAFDPVLRWAADSLGARLNVTTGVMHVAQPPEALAAIGAALDAYDDPVALAALSVMTTLTGSALLALASVAASSRPKRHGRPRMSMRTSRPSAGERTWRQWPDGRRAGANSRRRRLRSPSRARRNRWANGWGAYVRHH